ncbi:uncharacterized protein LOC118754416 isoform X1 [Rhagoletis pomonella]|uniref:uncharacterized protein LOC118754416 isoform X1 n=1 Tax=Rhagoletis pomonella TaxID=28610 RepID=UPI0017855800|nr:uncharacterized protein LOC118754416 isoform X1 [Rhagoletis pomonella]
MARKDDPVLNVRFVQLVENHPCLWNSTLPAYSKKDETQKAWQEVANETKDTVRNCRERWRTIRSSFLRSLKLSRTSTGRGKRKYYLSKYLQFLIPYTKTRLKNGSSSSSIIAQRKMTPQPPMTRINHIPLPIVSSDDTKDSNATEVAIAEEDVVVSLHEGATTQQHRITVHPPMAAPCAIPVPVVIPAPTAIKTEQGTTTPEHGRCTATAVPSMNACAIVGGATGGSGNAANHSAFAAAADSQPTPRSASAVDLTEFAEWIKSKNEHHRQCLMPSSPDADQSFLNSLHPFLKEMSGKQNRRFRQKVVALIDAILDNAD